MATQGLFNIVVNGGMIYTRSTFTVLLVEEQRGKIMAVQLPEITTSNSHVNETQCWSNLAHQAAFVEAVDRCRFGSGLYSRLPSICQLTSGPKQKH